MKLPQDLKYTKDHEWIQILGNIGIIGVTHYALEQLGDVVYLELPKVGTKFHAHASFGTIESTKTVSDLFLPADGEILEINQTVIDSPELLTKDAYNEGWLVKIKIQDLPKNLLTASEYENYLKVSH